MPLQLFGNTITLTLQIKMKAYRFFVIYTAMMSFALFGCIGVQRSANSSVSIQEPLFGIQCKVMEYGTISMV